MSCNLYRCLSPSLLSSTWETEAHGAATRSCNELVSIRSCEPGSTYVPGMVEWMCLPSSHKCIRQVISWPGSFSGKKWEDVTEKVASLHVLPTAAPWRERLALESSQPDQIPARSLLPEGHTQSRSYTSHNFLPPEAEGVTVTRWWHSELCPLRFRCRKGFSAQLQVCS